MGNDDRITRANELYERAVFGGDASALPDADRELDAVEADLALARGRVRHAQFLAGQDADEQERVLFEQATGLYRRLGDQRGEGEALLWTGVFRQVVRGDTAGALPLFERSYDLATGAGDKLTMSYAARHIGYAYSEDGRADAARERFEESVRLRREIGFLPGVAAGLLALSELARQQGQDQEARSLLDQADAVAAESGAHGIQRWIAQERAELGNQ